MTRALVAVMTALLVGTAPAEAKRRVFVNGDSLAVGTRPYMPAALPGWGVRTSASISRHAAEGPAVLRARPRLPRFVAVSLGTNDDPRSTSAFRSAIEETMEVAGTRRCVVWANIVRPPVASVTYSGYNRVLRQAAREWDNLEIVDWRRLVRRHPEWLADDGVHVSAAGYQARAREYARAIRRCPRGNRRTLRISTRGNVRSGP